MVSNTRRKHSMQRGDQPALLWMQRGFTYADRADMVVRYFLGNATTWRGADAKRIKAELKSLLKS
jgi:hypothetical protein